MVQDRRTTPEAIDISELSPAEQVAVWTLRCVSHGLPTCHGRVAKTPPGLAHDLHAVISAFQAFQEQMVQQRWLGLRMGAWGSLRLTRDERRLLKAISAIQAGQTELADNFLFRFAPSRFVRPSLTQAVTALAATLGTAGYWLPQPAQTWPLPAGALSVARLHGADLGDITIAWPR